MSRSISSDRDSVASTHSSTSGPKGSSFSEAKHESDKILASSCSEFVELAKKKVELGVTLPELKDILSGFKTLYFKRHPKTWFRLRARTSHDSIDRIVKKIESCDGLNQAGSELISEQSKHASDGAWAQLLSVLSESVRYTVVAFPDRAGSLDSASYLLYKHMNDLAVSSGDYCDFGEDLSDGQIPSCCL